MFRLQLIAFLDFIDRRLVVRRTVLAFTLYMTYCVTQDAWEFANMALANHYEGVGIAAIITAITVPLAAIQKFAFSLYSDARSSDKNTEAK